MPIESRIPIDELNIKDLSLGSPERNSQPLFDVENAISAEKWDELIETQKAETDLHRKLSNGAAFKIISPEKFERIKMTNAEYNDFSDSHFEGGDDVGRIKTAQYLK